MPGRSTKRCSPYRARSDVVPHHRTRLHGPAREGEAVAGAARQSLQAVGFDTDGRTAIDWGVYGAPETFLVDGAGAGDLQVHLRHDAGGLAARVLAADRRGAPERRMSGAPPGEWLRASGLLAGALGARWNRGSWRRARELGTRGGRQGSSRIRPCRPASSASPHDLRCLVCQNESIADSNVELAARSSPAGARDADRRQERRCDIRVHDRPLRRVRAIQTAAGAKTLLIWGAPFIMLAAGRHHHLSSGASALAHAAGR